MVAHVSAIIKASVSLIVTDMKLAVRSRTRCIALTAVIPLASIIDHVLEQDVRRGKLASEMIAKYFAVVLTLQLPLAAKPSHVSSSKASLFDNLVQRSVGGVIMKAAGIPDPIEHFEGNFYGVTASVALNMNTRVAHVSLRGYPIAGSVEGSGWLKDSGKEKGAVVLEPEFEARLSRRFVSIQAAELNREKHTVTVYATVPILGALALTLNRV